MVPPVGYWQVAPKRYLPVMRRAAVGSGAVRQCRRKLPSAMCALGLTVEPLALKKVTEERVRTGSQMERAQSRYHVYFANGNHMTDLSATVRQRY